MAGSAPRATPTAGRRVIAVDLFGTLLSTESIARQLAALFGEDDARAIAAQWRRYQLEYSWRITCMGKHPSPLSFIGAKPRVGSAIEAPLDSCS